MVQHGITRQGTSALKEDRSPEKTSAAPAAAAIAAAAAAGAATSKMMMGPTCTCFVTLTHGKGP